MMLQHIQRFKDRRVLVLGLGLSGRSAVHFLLKRGALVAGVDGNSSLDKHVSDLCLKGMEFFHEDLPPDLRGFDLVVVSPGIPSNHKIYKEAMQLGLEVIGEVELACREITQTCLGVTGTNGKTTVTLLVAHILEASGIKVRALGNVGIPLTSAVEETISDKAEVFVIELSSYQLETLTKPVLDAGVILNITPDHLDRYPSMNDYASAKIGIKKNIKDQGTLFVEAKCMNDYRHLFEVGSDARCYNYGYRSNDYLYTDLKDVYCQGEKIFSLPLEYQGRRTHDLENILASYSLCSTLSISPEQFLTGLSSFKKPSHRMEFVRTIRGVNYYDDSKGTNVDAVIRAVQGVNGDVILIAGGVDKGFPYTSWIEAFDGKVKAVCAIGQSKEKIKNDLGQFIPVTLFNHFDEAVAYACSLAKSGENVLLSPGCSSFDMFKDYAHRGQEFQRIINAL